MEKQPTHKSRRAETKAQLASQGQLVQILAKINECGCIYREESGGEETLKQVVSTTKENLLCHLLCMCESDIKLQRGTTG